MDYLKNDLTSLHQMLVNKELSASELMQATFDGIAKREPQIDAFLAINND